MKYSILILLAALALPFAARSQAVILKTDTVSISCSSTDTFLMPVRVRNFTGVASMQFTLSWTPSQLKYAYVTDGAGNLFFDGSATAGFDTTNFINQGKLTFTWTRVGGASFPDDSPVFFVAFRRTGGPFSPVTFVNTPVGIEVADKNGDELLHQLMPGGVLPIDTLPPTITCPAGVTVQGSGPTPVNGISPTSVADNCTVQQVGWSVSGATTGNFPTDPDASGANFNLGLSTVVYKVTDVGNATATCSLTVMVEPSITSDTLTIVAGGGSASCGQSIAIPITALNFDSLGSLQFSVKWDTAALKFDSVTIVGSALTLDANNFGIAQTANGFLSFSWTSNIPLVGTTIPNGSLLFRVHLSPKSGNAGSSQVGFGDFPTFREAYTSATNPPEEVAAFYIPGQVSVADNTPPTIVCPPNISVQTQPGELTANITGTAPTTLSDNCSGNVALAYAQGGTTTNTGTGNANGTYNAGTTTVTYTATDASGNTATCTFQVFVDAGKPVLLALDSVETDCAGSTLQTIAVPLTVSNFNDLIGLQFSIEWDEAALSLDKITGVFPGLGLTPTSSAFIYTDTMSGILRFLGGTAGTWPDIPDGGTLFVLNFIVKTPGALSPITFLPPFDAVNQAFQSVLVNTINGGFKSTADLNGPEFTFCPADTLVMTTAPDCAAIINFQPLATDDCSGLASIISPNHPGNVFEPGMTTVVYIATDSVGNTSECGFQVFVQPDNKLDLKNCPPALVNGFVTATDCEVPVFWQEPDVVGLCDATNIQIEVNAEPGDTFSVSVSKTVTFVATDTVSGEFALCSWTVVVLDTIAPKITCPKDTTLLPNSANCSAIVGGLLPLASDNCDTDPDIGSTKLLPMDTFQIGATKVQVIAADDSGNFASCEFTVTVIDNQAPVFTCPQDTVFSVDPGTCMATVGWITPQAFDNCDTTVLTPTPDVQSGTQLPLGEKIVTYSATDKQGNKASCTFTVTVTDTELPTVDCPSDILINLPLTKCDTALNWQPAFPSDNCGIKTFGADVPQGSVFEAKTTTVTYTVEDNAGNTATCSFTITAKDGVRPVIANCPKDTVVNTTDPCGAMVSWNLPTATDNCTPEAELVWSSSHQPGAMFSIATTGVQITVADGSGNLDTCKFNVKVVSTVTPGFDKVPASQMLIGCEAIATWEPVTVKGFCILPTLDSTHMPGDTFKLGTTVVTYMATDDKGTTYTATFSITVSEITPPVLTGCPTDSIVVNTSGETIHGAGPFLTSVTAGPNCSGAVLSFLSPLATDNCGLAVVEQTTGQASGALFAPGSSVVTFKATDASGNSSTCSVKVTVLGVALPEVMLDAEVGCPGGSLQLIATPSVPNATYTWTGPQGGNFPNNDTITLTDLNLQNIGQYKVVVSLGACASASDSTVVTLAQKADAVDDFTFTLDPGAVDTFDVFANDLIPNLADVDLTFSPLSGLSELSPGSGKFIFTAGQVGGKFSFVYKICSKKCPSQTLCDMATVTITVRESDCTFVPNIITPNGDTENDVLVIPCLENSTLFRSNSIVIYNQWGDKVFEASPYQNNWGGTLDNEPGKNLPDGTYFYIFRPGPNEAVLKGFVEIYR